MCMMVYIASDYKLPCIDYKKESPDFFVQEISEGDFGYIEVWKMMNKKFIYNVGSYTGCGCGFNYGTYELYDEDDIKEDNLGKEAVKKLFDYIKECLTDIKHIYLFTCVAGNEYKQPERTLLMNVGEIKLGDEFSFSNCNELRIISS